jgi:glycosyltransferase involved in cell wall biosynthesis
MTMPAAERDAVSTTRGPGSTRSAIHVLLVGNYEPDRQESMQRFADCLLRDLPRHGVSVELIRPAVWFGRRPTGSGLDKWLAYLDKFVLFPPVLRRRIQRAPSGTIIHVADHSNSVYLRDEFESRQMATCHDLLAVRGALGEPTDCPASPTGRLLQRMILRGLGKAALVVCDSTATENDFRRLTDGRRRSRVVWIGLNGPFHKLATEESVLRLAPTGEALLDTPFLLLVGSSLRRKNREFALHLLARLAPEWPGRVVIAGEALTTSQRLLMHSLGVSDRVIEVQRPSHEVLEALYSRAHALLFPSRFEGFGWPIIEAQACGCPVVCSNTTSLPEVAGNGALIRDVDDEEGFVAAILSLRDPATRDELVRRGHENAKRFAPERMIEDYVSAYRSLATP